MARSYSGRGMYGKSCLAFESMEEFVEAIKEDACDEDSGGILPSEGWETDSMGLGIVIYNRYVTYENWNKTYGDHDDGDMECDYCGDVNASVKLIKCEDADEDGSLVCQACVDADAE